MRWCGIMSTTMAFIMSKNGGENYYSVRKEICMESKILKCSNGDFELGYYIYEPKQRNAEKLPMIVFLHGARERGNGTTDLEKVKVHGLPKYINEGKEYPAIVLAPQCPKGIVWNNIVFALKELIDNVIENYNVDTKRVSITGLSMGGFGTWEMGIIYPELFSAIAPVCGGGLTWRCDLLKNIPVWAFHGDIDTTVLLKNSIEMVDAVNKFGGNARLTIMHNVGHNCWDEAYTASNVIEWLLSQSKE